LRSNRSTGVVRGCPDLRPRTVSSTMGPMGRPTRSSALRIQVTARKSLWAKVGSWWGEAVSCGVDMALITALYARANENRKNRCREQALTPPKLEALLHEVASCYL
jgi:hypothetical protein